LGFFVLSVDKIIILFSIIKFSIVKMLLVVWVSCGGIFNFAVALAIRLCLNKGDKKSRKQKLIPILIYKSWDFIVN